MRAENYKMIAIRDGNHDATSKYSSSKTKTLTFDNLYKTS